MKRGTQNTFWDNLHKRSAACPRGRDACPVPGLSGRAQYTECVDTQSSLESCGACVLLGESGDGERGSLGGRDCSAIPNTDDVRCVAGTCEICESFLALMKVSKMFLTHICAYREVR